MAEDLAKKLSLPPCPKGSELTFIPNPVSPSWISCRDEEGLYQGFLIQMSNQGEMVRIALMKNSKRNGREIRFGQPKFIEERNYLNGHLTQDSYIFEAEVVLDRIIPKPMTPKFWQDFSASTGTSLLGIWLKKAPFSVIHFESGRMNRIRFDQKDYHFTIAPEGRIFSNDHPEMFDKKKKTHAFFIDPEPMWNLDSEGLRRAILPGFGSCKKYSGPISRFGRHYDHLIYVRERSELKHQANLAEIRERFLNFCVPHDLREHLGILECPPQLPGMMTPAHCLLPISDQMKIPYEPKYFTFDYTIGVSPEAFIDLFGIDNLLAFLTDSGRTYVYKFFPPKTLVVIKKTQKKLVYRILRDHAMSHSVGGKDLDQTEWWDWHSFPGSE